MTVTIESDEEALPGFTRQEINELVAPALAQESQGAGTTCHNGEEVDAHFDALRAKVDAKYGSKA